MSTSTRTSMTSSMKNSRPARASKNRDDDRITNLSESMVCHIMSRLPTKDAVRTSILSKDWRYKWTFSYNVNVDDMCWYPCTGRSFNKEGFVNFIDGILLSSQRCLRSFRFKSLFYSDLSRVQMWISAVLRQHHEDLESFEVNIAQKGIVFPCSLVNSTSLRTLKLKQCGCTLNVATKNYIPNLTSLLLDGLLIVNENANTRTVAFAFPVLKVMTLGKCTWLNLDSVEIYAPSLTTFVSRPPNWNEDYDYSITIVAPRLTKLAYNRGLPQKLFLDGSSIVSAFLNSHGELEDFHVLANIGLRVRNLVNAFANLEELELSSFMATVSQFGPPLRRHDKLKQLTLRGQGYAGVLFELLHSAPSLKSLCISVCEFEWGDHDYGVMESIPSCIVSQLEEVFFCQFPEVVNATRSSTECKLAEIFLNNAGQLKKLCLMGNAEKLQDLRKLLLSFPKRSPNLTIEVHSRSMTNRPEGVVFGK